MITQIRFTTYTQSRRSETRPGLLFSLFFLIHLSNLLLHGSCKSHFRLPFLRWLEIELDRSKWKRGSLCLGLSIFFTIIPAHVSSTICRLQQRISNECRIEAWFLLISFVRHFIVAPTVSSRWKPIVRSRSALKPWTFPSLFLVHRVS